MTIQQGEKPKNRRSLQRMAADLMMEGHGAHDISRILGIRLDTVLRWQHSSTFQARITLHKAAMREEMALGMVRAMRQTGRYAAEHPNGKLGNVMEMLAQIAKLSQQIGI